MEQNSLIEIGSKANVIVRFIAETTINGSTYAAGEPYLFLQNVNLVIRYKEVSKTGTSTFNNISNNRIYPESIVMTHISFSRKLCSLLTAFEASSAAFNPTKAMTLTAETGIIYLPEEVKDENGFYVYSEEFAPITVTYTEATNSLSGAGLVSGSQYLVFFSSVKTGTRYSFNQPCVPYMSLEIQGTGNINKQTKNVLIFISKASLNSPMQFNFMPDDMINIPLEFKIIENTNNFIYFED